MLHPVAILDEDGFVKALVVAPPRHDLAREAGDHEARDEGELVGHLEDDEHGGDGRLNDSAEAGAHSADGEEHLIRIVQGGELTAKPAEGDTAHAAEKEAGREDAAGASKAVARDGGDQLGEKQREGEFPRDAFHQREREIIVTESENAEVSRRFDR